MTLCVQRVCMMLKNKFLLGTNLKNYSLVGETNLWWGKSSRRNFSRWKDKQIFGLWGHSLLVGKTL